MAPGEIRLKFSGIRGFFPAACAVELKAKVEKAGNFLRLVTAK